MAMMLRPPQSAVRKETENALDYEIVQEQAAALGRLGRALEAALASLARHDRAHAESGSESTAGRSAPSAAIRSANRERLLQEAGYALWCFIIQREACGLRDQRLMIRDYGVPREVQNRMGVFGASGAGPAA
jgi:hypothetical protein